MKRDRNADAPHQRGPLLIACGILGGLGNLAPLVTMIWAGSMLEHDFLADTISDLGRGPYHEIMDTGFYCGAAGLLALAIGTAHAHMGRWGWSVGLFCLAGLALNVTLVGIWDAFHDTLGPDEALSIHTRLTYALGLLYLAGPLLMAKGAARVDGRYATSFWAAAALWVVFATAFKLAPDSYDGLLEKIAAAATLLWTLPLSWLLVSRGRAAL